MSAPAPVTGRLADPPSQSIFISIACPWCRAAAGETCRTPSGRATPLHRIRWDQVISARRSRPMVYRLKSDDEGFGLSAGDLLLSIDYPLDSKITVLARLSDGFDPRCNQYLANVEFIRWATAEDIATSKEED